MELFVTHEKKSLVPRVSAKVELSYKSLKSKFSLIHFAYNLMIGYCKKNRENYPGECF